MLLYLDVHYNRVNTTIYLKVTKYDGHGNH